MSLINQQTLSTRVGIVPMRRTVRIYPYQKVDSYGAAIPVMAELRPIRKQEAGGPGTGTTEKDSREIIVMRHELKGYVLKLYDLVKTDDGGERFWQVDSIGEKGLGARIVLGTTKTSGPDVAAGIE